MFAESDSGEGEFIVFPLDFWEVRVERGLGINTGFTEKSKSCPPPQFSPHALNKASSCAAQDWKGRPRKQNLQQQQVNCRGVGVGEGESPGPLGEGDHRCPRCFSPLLQELSRQQKGSIQPKRETAQPGCPKMQWGPTRV